MPRAALQPTSVRRFAWCTYWIPAFAGMTAEVSGRHTMGLYRKTIAFAGMTAVVSGRRMRTRVGYANLLLMNTNYSAVVKQDGGWWIGWLEELAGINCQEATREALIESLRIT